MLNEEEKLRIELEERYRWEVRERLAPTVPPRDKIWRLLNSAFTLWLLSTVVVGSIAFMFERWDRRREATRLVAAENAARENQRRNTAQNLDAEVSSRLSYVNHVLTTPEIYAHEERRAEQLVNALMALELPSLSEYPVGVFPEYANRNFQSLLWELLQNVPDSDKTSLQTALEQSKTLPSIYLFEARRKRVFPGTPGKSPSVGTTQSQEWAEKWEWARLLFRRVENESTTGNARKLLAPFNLDRWGHPLETFLN